MLDPELIAALERYVSTAEGRRALISLLSADPLDGGTASESMELVGPTLAPGELELESSDAAAPNQGEPPERYVDLGLIAVGGMGEVRRVRDIELNRVLAMKISHPGPGRPADAVARFVEEAQIAAQLQHPGLVPVHDLGRLPDGRAWFTMAEVRGRTLTAVIGEVHAGRGGAWTLRRLLAAFYQACETMAYAHSRGVVHRDLKPDNVMVGEFNEILVMDWGLAKVRGRPDLAGDAGALDVVATHRSASGRHTRVGVITGTPAYMAPEQAYGQVDRIDARSDVYALGAILYEILTGRPPYAGTDAWDIVRQVRGAGPEPLDARRDLPESLVAACERAMARDPAARYPDAEALAAAVRRWLDGEERREKALEVVAEADAHRPRAEALRMMALELRDEAAALLEGVPPWAPEERKADGWAKEDAAKRLEQEAALAELAYRETLRTALDHAPDLAEAHERLAALYRERHAEAEAERNDDAAAQWETLLRQHDRSGEHAAYLKGDGALTLITEPPGAEVLLFRYVPQHRRLVEVFERSLGTTPLRDVPLPSGSYLCLLRHPSRAEVRYPVRIGRNERWDGVRPGEADPHPVWLPEPRDLGPDDRYVPAGWFLAGDARSYGSLPVGTRLWCDGFVMRQFPVTNREYIAFLDDLVADGREEEALRYAPRDAAGQHDKEGALIYGRDDEGRFRLVADGQGDVWPPDWPVIMVDWHCACAFARWAAARSGRPWRLPWEFEWEKAARGTDGRIHPWGDAVDPTYSCYRESHRGRPLPEVVDSYPVDVSPYGVRGLGGNVKDWCADVWSKKAVVPPDRIVRPAGAQDGSEVTRRSDRGGAWLGTSERLAAATRYGVHPSLRHPSVGFRLARSLPLP